VAEREILREVQKRGAFLVLLDGRKLRVRPRDLPKSANWFVMAEIEMSDESDDTLYTIMVRNLTQNEEVLAMWASL
jgi:hypothetical protein